MPPGVSMKYLMIAICVFSVGWAVVNKVTSKKADQSEQAEAPANAGPTYVSMESNGPVFRITPDTRKEVDRYSAEKVVMFGATWCGYCAANRKIFAERGVQYVEIDIDRDPAALAFMQKTLGSPGVPTTVLGTRLIPGFSASELELAIKKL
jgi:glutaredoxin